MLFVLNSTYHLSLSLSLSLSLAYTLLHTQQDGDREEHGKDKLTSATAIDEQESRGGDTSDVGSSSNGGSEEGVVKDNGNLVSLHTDKPVSVAVATENSKENGGQ